MKMCTVWPFLFNYKYGWKVWKVCWERGVVGRKEDKRCRVLPGNVHSLVMHALQLNLLPSSSFVQQTKTLRSISNSLLSFPSPEFKTSCTLTKPPKLSVSLKNSSQLKSLSSSTVPLPFPELSQLLKYSIRPLYPPYCWKSVRCFPGR